MIMIIIIIIIIIIIKFVFCTLVRNFWKIYLE